MSMPEIITESEYQQYDKMYRHICDEMIPAVWAQYGVLPGEQWLEEMITTQNMREALRETLAHAIEEATDAVS